MTPSTANPQQGAGMAADRMNVAMRSRNVSNRERTTATSDHTDSTSYLYGTANGQVVPRHFHDWHRHTLTGEEHWDQCATCDKFRTKRPVMNTDRRQTCWCTHRWGDHARGGACLATVDSDSSIGNLGAGTCACREWRP